MLLSKFQGKYLALSSIFPMANMTVLPPGQFRFFEENANLLNKEQFYSENYGSLPLMVNKVPKPIDFMVQNEDLIRKLFTIRPE